MLARTPQDNTGCCTVYGIPYTVPSLMVTLLWHVGCNLGHASSNSLFLVCADSHAMDLLQMPVSKRDVGANCTELLVAAAAAKWVSFVHVFKHGVPLHGTFRTQGMQVGCSHEPGITDCCTAVIWYAERESLQADSISVQCMLSR